MKSLFSRSVLRWIALAGTLALLALSALLPATAFAASAEKQPNCAANNVKCVTSYGDTLIAIRQQLLHTLNDKVTASLKKNEITSAQASVLQADVATNLNYLKQYKQKLDAEKSVPSARQDLNDLWTKLRIYAVVLPRDYRILELDYEINAEVVMQNISPVIQAGLTYAPTDKQSQLNTLYSDYTKQIADAQPQVQSAQGALPALTVDNFNQHQDTFQANKNTADKALQTASTALFKAADDLK
ncbi:MAG TPA: hypothetical protein VF458_16750, partial [Ktedonobacteraceae bacterium]